MKDVHEVEGWQLLAEWGMKPREIANEVGRSPGFVAATLEVATPDDELEEPISPLRAKHEPGPPTVAIIWPEGVFSPNSKCAHDGPLPRGSALYCPVCDACGLDGVHPALYRDPDLDPPRERPTGVLSKTKSARLERMAKARSQIGIK